jgi:hypothetical protein
MKKLDETIRNIGCFTFIAVALFTAGLYYESKQDPYAEGSHWDYLIHCENGFVYKIKNRASIQVLNSDGTPLRCGKKIY